VFVLILFLGIIGLNGHASGQWFSGNESIVSVDFLSGKAVAHGEGIALGTE